MSNKTFVSMHFKGNDVTYKRDEINHDYDNKLVIEVLISGSGERISCPSFNNQHDDTSWSRNGKGILTKRYDNYIDFKD